LVGAKEGSSIARQGPIQGVLLSEFDTAGHGVIQEGMF